MFSPCVMHLRITPKFHQMRVQCVSTLEWQQSWYVSILVSVCASTGCSYVAFVIHCSSSGLEPSAVEPRASIFAGCTMQQFSSEQMGQDRKSYTDTTLKHSGKFRIQHTVLTPDHISLIFINKLSLCAEPGLKSTDQRFSEAAVAFDSVMIAKFLSVL